MIRVKRVYEPPARSDGRRFLVDRLWPRGIAKAALATVVWLREVAPSHELRKWFHHEPERWAEFQRRYRAELAARPEAWRLLLEAARDGDVTLLFSARDLDRNNAVALQAFLDEQLGTATAGSRSTMLIPGGGTRARSNRSRPA
jgi:uncharacterized protein YeaO (DUF488 family)